SRNYGAVGCDSAFRHGRKLDRAPCQERVHSEPGAVMELSERNPSSLDTIAGHPERVCSVAEGATPPPGIEAVSSSWQRSAKNYGLDPVDSKAPGMRAAVQWRRLG